MPDDPIQPLIDQLAALMKLAEESASKPLKGPVDPAIQKRLEEVEKSLALFKSVNQKWLPLQKKGTSENALKRFLDSPDQFSPKEQKLLRQCLALGVNAVLLRGGLMSARKSAGKSKQYEVGKNTQKSIQQRRKKFKGMGDGEKWKRL